MEEYRTLHVDSSGPGVRGDFMTRNPPPRERGGTESHGAPSPFTGGHQFEDRLAREEPQLIPEDEKNENDLHAILNIPPQLRVAPKPRLPPVVEKKGWACPLCTFLNDPQRPGCEQCGTERPKDYVVPDDLKDEAERKAIDNERLFLEVNLLYMCRQLRNVCVFVSAHCVQMCLCMYVCVHACMYLCMYVGTIVFIEGIINTYRLDFYSCTNNLRT